MLKVSWILAILQSKYERTMIPKNVIQDTLLQAYNFSFMMCMMYLVFMTGPKLIVTHFKTLSFTLFY